MLTGKTREEYEEVLIKPILNIKRKRKVVQTIKENLLRNHKILEGNVQSIINNPRKELPKLDWRILVLLGQQVYYSTKDKAIDPKLFYTVPEIKKAKQYTGKLILKGDIELPLVLDDAIKISHSEYLTIIPVKTLAQMSALLLNYNFDIQREAKKKIVGGETIQEATLIMENVLEIKEHLKKDSLIVTNIVINASAGTSDIGEELIYDEEKRQLIISEGTRLDIVDGYHRCKATELALNENPDIDFKFAVLFLNYTDDQAAKYQGQLAKATPITRSRQKQLSEDRYADIIVNNLNTRSELADKITNNSLPNLEKGELVSYDILANTIDSEFELNRMYDVHKVSDYLIKYFDFLLGYYEEIFLVNPVKNKKETLMLENSMYIGYLILAKRMYEKNIEFTNAIDFLEKIDFSRDNNLWKEINILDEKGNLTYTETVRKQIKEYFYSIPIQ